MFSYPFGKVLTNQSDVISWFNGNGISINDSNIKYLHIVKNKIYIVINNYYDKEWNTAKGFKDIYKYMTTEGTRIFNFDKYDTIPLSSGDEKPS